MYYQIGGLLILAPLTMSINYTSGQPMLTFHDVSLTVLSLAVCIAWIFYFKQSSRVKRTFVFTYPELPWRMELIKHMNAVITDTFAEEKEQS